MSIEFLITSLIVVATPGTGGLYTLAAGLSRGMRAMKREHQKLGKLLTQSDFGPFLADLRT